MYSVAHSSLKRLENLLVVDVMARNLATVPSSATMEEAAALLTKHKVSGAPVIDVEGRCIGVLSAADFLRFDERARRPQGPCCGDDSAAPTGGLPWNSVQRYMTTPVHSISPAAPMMQAAELMCLRHIHRVVVLDADERPVGLVSTLDVVSALLFAIEEDRQEQLFLRSRRET